MDKMVGDSSVLHEVFQKQNLQSRLDRKVGNSSVFTRIVEQCASEPISDKQRYFIVNIFETVNGRNATFV